MQASGTVTSPAQGRFFAHLATGPEAFAEEAAALTALEAALRQEATALAERAGVTAPRLAVESDVQHAEIEGQPMFVSAELRVTATGRPRIATG